MRKNIVAGLACALLVLTACPADSGTTTESANTVATTAPEEMTTGTTAPTTTAGPDVCADQPAPGGVMEKFGAPCSEDSDCEAVLGEDGVCLTDILGLYGLPCGFCSRLCMLPDFMTAYVENDPICGDGVTCIGAMGYFEGCVIECNDNSDCPRAGYECRLMPELGAEGDPKFCLMTEDNKFE